MRKLRILATSCASFAILAGAAAATAGPAVAASTVKAVPALANRCGATPIAPNGAWGGCDSMVAGEHARVWVECAHRYRNFGPYMTRNGQRSFAACNGSDPRTNYGVEDLINT